MKIIRSHEHINKRWSGGTTTELYIYPEKSTYVSLNFNFRLSRATIEVDTSEFTALQDVKRELMLTKGALKLVHQHKYNKTLKPFQTDQFSGNWQTKSIGKAEDFNLMLMQDTEGYLESLHSSIDTSKTIDSECDYLAIYCLLGGVNIDSETVLKNDIAVISQPEKLTSFHMHKHSDVVIVRIWLNN